jgi:glycosyltransferase involved in cell wall biosynthesis
MISHSRPPQWSDNKMKPTVLFITFGDNSVPSSRTRIQTYMEIIEAESEYLCCKRIFPWKENENRDLISVIRRKVMRFIFHCRALYAALPADLVFIQKCLLAVPAIAVLKLMRKTLVFDFDDAVFITHPQYYWSPRWEAKMRKRLVAVTAASSSIIVSTEELLQGREMVPHFRKAVIIPTPIDTSKFKFSNTPETGGRFIIGWTGTPANTYYLRPCMPALAAVARRFRIKLELIGADASCLQKAWGFPVEYIDWSQTDEDARLSSWHIGLMPLEDDLWSRCKGGYKLLLYMATGAIGIASAVGMNKRIIRDAENGFLVGPNWYDWESTLTHVLSTYSSNAYNVRRNARETVKKYYSVSYCYPLFKEVLDNALRIRKKPSITES